MKAVRNVKVGRLSRQFRHSFMLSRNKGSHSFRNITKPFSA